ncbi:MAG: winged helix-turn-helix domain-containing protein [Candidatus Nitrosopolaris sp.]
MSRTEVVMMMLEAANNGRATITKIMHRALLSHSVSKEYLTLLVKHDLLVHEKGNETYITTEKGKRLLRICGKMNGLATT